MELDVQIVSLGAKFAEITAEKGCYKKSGTSCSTENEFAGFLSISRFPMSGHRPRLTGPII